MSNNNEQEQLVEEKNLEELEIYSIVELSNVPLDTITNQTIDWVNEVEENRPKKVYGLKDNAKS